MTQQTKKQTARVATAKGNELAVNPMAQVTETVKAAHASLVASRASLVGQEGKVENARKAFSANLKAFVKAQTGVEYLGDLTNRESNPKRAEAFTLMTAEIKALKDALKEANKSAAYCRMIEKRVTDYATRRNIDEVEKKSGGNAGTKKPREFSVALLEDACELYERSFKPNNAKQDLTPQARAFLEALEDALKAVNVNIAALEKSGEGEAKCDIPSLVAKALAQPMKKAA